VRAVERGSLRPVVRQMVRPEIPRGLAAVAVGVAGELCALGLLATSAWLITTASLRPPVLTLSVAIAAVRIFALARGAGRYGERLASHDLALRALARLRVWAYRRLEPLVPGGLPDIRTGDLLARLVADVDATQDLVVRIAVPFATGLATAAVAVTLTSLILPPAGLVLAAGLVAGGLLVPGAARAAGRRTTGRLAAQRGEITAQLVETLEGASDLVAFGATGEALATLGTAECALSGTARRSGLLVGLADGLEAFVTGATTIAVVALGVRALGARHLPAVDVAVLGFVALASFEALRSLPESFTRMDVALGAGRRVGALAGMVTPVAEPGTPPRTPPRTPPAATPAAATPAAAAPPAATPWGATPTAATPWGATGEPPTYVLRRAGATYGPERSPAVADVDLVLAPGRRIALVGPSGAGKSTVAAMLLRFVEVSSGSAEVNGTDVRRLASDDVRRLIAWSPQDPHIFATTLAANLRLARPGATDAELATTLQALGLGRWLEGLGDGLITVLGERGATVSGGEGQRIGLARALLAERPILLLDEPTAHLDDESEALVRHRVLAASEGRSLLWITHRLVGLADFDEVMVLDAGHVVGRRAGALSGAAGAAGSLAP